MECLEDCDFEELLSVSSNFTSYHSDDTTHFAINAVENLPADAAALCVYSFESLDIYEEMNASMLLENIRNLKKNKFPNW